MLGSHWSLPLIYYPIFPLTTCIYYLIMFYYLFFWTGKSLWQLVLEQFDDLLVKILLLAAVVSFVSISIYRRWAGKTSYVHLAPEYEYRYKHLMKAYKNQFKTCSMAINTFKGFCWLSCGPATCMKLILFRSSFLFDSKFMFRDQMHIWGFSCPATLCAIFSDILLFCWQVSWPNSRCAQRPTPYSVSR